MVSPCRLIVARTKVRAFHILSCRSNNGHWEKRNQADFVLNGEVAFPGIDLHHKTANAAHDFLKVWMWVLSLPMGLAPAGVRLSELHKDLLRNRPVKETRPPHYGVYAWWTSLSWRQPTIVYGLVPGQGVSFRDGPEKHGYRPLSPAAAASSTKRSAMSRKMSSFAWNALTISGSK